MFDTTITMTGKHAEFLKKYSKDKQAEEQFLFEIHDNEGNNHTIYIFDTMIQAYMCSAMIGIIERTKVAEDKTSKTTANIFADAVIKNRPFLKRITQFMILSADDEAIDQKIKNAFSIEKNEVDIQNLINSYVRGGLEIIDDYFKLCSTYSDVMYAILNLMDKYGDVLEE